MIKIIKPANIQQNTNPIEVLEVFYYNIMQLIVQISNRIHKRIASEPKIKNYLGNSYAKTTF
uniref:Uncharacterized protein n=1 Tax=Rhizophora mucronata TaxID=61149 RepID=A0A2P2KQS2_RHIMU